MRTELQGIYAANIEQWFNTHVPGTQGPLAFTLIAGGHSNLTFKVEDASGRQYALRRPPLGFTPRMGAHDVVREHRILSKLGHSSVPVPRMVGVCTDAEVNGAPFYVMHWVEGQVLDRDERVAQTLTEPGSRTRAAFDLVDNLAQLHQCDPDAIGLGDLGQRENYLERQLQRTAQVWGKIKTRELPAIDALHQQLTARRPPQRYTGIVHGDYRFGNMMLEPSGRINAVLDWELCALGDVMMDVGYLLTSWDLPDDPWPDVWMQRAPSRAGGFPTRDELLARYAEKTGFALRDIPYYCAFCYWRNAVIAEGMMRRYTEGSMSAQHADLDALDRRVQARAAMASSSLERFESV